MMGFAATRRSSYPHCLEGPSDSNVSVMHRLGVRTYRWLRLLGACLGGIAGVFALLRRLAAEDAAFALAGSNRTDVDPFGLPLFLLLGALAGWTVVVLVSHFADVVPTNCEGPEG